jgi:hypothetical protein
MGHAPPFALVEPHTSFTLTSRRCHDNQVVALGPMLSCQIAFGFGKNRQWSGGESRAGTRLVEKLI